jgi:hypothetical protein
MIYVLRDGQMVEKTTIDLRQFAKTANFPTPAISRFEAFDSPVTGQPISSWRQRERDMHQADAVDPRDISRAALEKRQRIVERNVRARESE